MMDAAEVMGVGGVVFGIGLVLAYAGAPAGLTLTLVTAGAGLVWLPMLAKGMEGR